MREIEFRAWNKKEKRMFNNVYIVGDDVLCALDELEPNGLDVIADINDVIIEQYTGLKDKNGTKIYEGDILRYIDKPHEWHYIITNQHDKYYGVFAKCIYRNFDTKESEYGEHEYVFGDFYDTNEINQFVYVDSKRYVVISNVHEEEKYE